MAGVELAGVRVRAIFVPGHSMDSAIEELVRRSQEAIASAPK